MEWGVFDQPAHQRVRLVLANLEHKQYAAWHEEAHRTPDEHQPYDRSATFLTPRRARRGLEHPGISLACTRKTPPGRHSLAGSRFRGPGSQRPLRVTARAKVFGASLILGDTWTANAERSCACGRREVPVTSVR